MNAFFTEILRIYKTGAAFATSKLFYFVYPRNSHLRYRSQIIEVYFNNYYIRQDMPSTYIFERIGKAMYYRRDDMYIIFIITYNGCKAQ